VIADPSHAAGHRELVPALARTAVAGGADGLLVEVHPNPDKAWSDGEQSLDFAGFDAMMDGLSTWLAARTQQLERRDAPGARPMEAVG
jgi:3-deoxy-D-arabino-heptulosonate 7-phosphate (DAHP) synthase